MIVLDWGRVGMYMTASSILILIASVYVELLLHQPI